MKRLVFILVLVFVISIAYAKDKPEKILEKVFDNMASIISVDAISEMTKENNIYSKKKNEVTKSTKRILIKKPNKQKVVYLDNVTKAPIVGVEPLIDTGEITENKSLYPVCLFDIERFLTNYELSVTDKDERIKRGREEVVAIKKGQEMSYPQIRIIVKNDQVELIKFYSITGKKYYEVIVNKYGKTKGIDFPEEITEKLYSKKNEIVNTIKYTQIELNETIPDSEFETQK